MEDSSEMSSDPDQLVAVIDEMESKIASLQVQVAEEVAKNEKYRVSKIWGYSCCCYLLFVAGKYSPEA